MELIMTLEDLAHIKLKKGYSNFVHNHFFVNRSYNYTQQILDIDVI